jgi:hypothetical protein
MMQTQWPGLGSSLDYSALERSLGDERSVAMGGFRRAQPSDGMTRRWWMPGNGIGAVNGNGDGAGSLSGFFGFENATNGSISGILYRAGGVAPATHRLVNQSQTQNQIPNQPHDPPCAPNAEQRRFEDLDVSSTGNPHLSAVGTREGPDGGTAVDAHWDSMTSENDLVHSTQIDGATAFSRR